MKNILKRFVIATVILVGITLVVVKFSDVVIATVIIVGINWVIDIVIASIRRLNG